MAFNKGRLCNIEHPLLFPLNERLESDMLVKKEKKRKNSLQRLKC